MENLPPSSTSPESTAADLPTIIRGRRRHLPLLPWMAGGCVLAMLAGVAFPQGDAMAKKQGQTKALACAKQVGLALRLFAGDNDGVYPTDGTPAELHGPTTSNAAFAALFPLYCTSEAIFANKFSAYQTKAADNVIDQTYTGKPGKTLEPGENVYAYVAGLTDSMDPATPLVVDGTDGTGHYVTDNAKHGGVWSGTEAIVIRLDNSGTLEKLAGPDAARYIPGKDGKGNLLDVAPLGKGVKLLDPAVAR